MALVNTGNDDDKVSEEIRQEVEIHLITKVTKKAKGSELYTAISDCPGATEYTTVLAKLQLTFSRKR